MSKTYLTTFKGDIQLDKDMSKDSLEIMNRGITKAFDDAASIDVKDAMIYLNGQIADTDESVEIFLYQIAQWLPQGHEEIVVEAQGEDPKDRYDLIIKENALYVRRYEFVAQPDEPYIPKDIG